MRQGKEELIKASTCDVQQGGEVEKHLMESDDGNGVMLSENKFCVDSIEACDVLRGVSRNAGLPNHRAHMVP